MTQQEYQKAYENIERAVELGVVSWKVGMAQAALLSLEYGRERGEVTANAVAKSVRDDLLG